MKIFKKILTVFLCIIMFASSAAGITAFLIKDTFENSSVVGVSIADAEYCDLLYDAVYASLEKKMALVVITPEDISDIVTKDTVTNAAPIACASLIDRLFGGDSKEWRFESDALRDKVSELLTDYAQKAGVEYEEGSAERVYEMICDTVSDEVGVISRIYVAKISPLFSKVRSLCGYWYVFMLIFAVSAAGVILLGKKHIKSALYNAILPTYLAMFTVSVSSWILYFKDYLAKTVLAGETFQYFLRQMYRISLSNIATVSTVIDVMLLIMGIVVIIAMVTGKRRIRAHHRHHHPEKAEEQ